MGNFKAYFILFAIAAFAFTGCKKDNAAPVISSIQVNGVENNSGNGLHALGSDVTFTITATDEGSLGYYEITKQTPSLEILKTGEIEGTSATFTYTFNIDTDTYPVGQEIKLLFLVEDARGSSESSLYTIVVDN